MATIGEVWAAYEKARGRWSGCDWPTRFGSQRLDLEGVSSLQARGIARRWRAVAAGEVACPCTPQENATLAAMGLCLRLGSPAVRTGEGGLAPPRLAPRPARRRCAEALADEWELAACVLEEIESDAGLAEREAWAAVRAAERGDWDGARGHVRRASALESGYHAPRLWGGLKSLIESVAARAETPASLDREAL
jgi:hypothetical protein